MWIWDLITKAKVVRSDNELKIQALAQWKVWAFGLTLSLVIIIICSLINLFIYGLIFFMIALQSLRFISMKMNESNSQPLIIQGKQLPKLMIPQQVELSNAVFPPPYFIDLEVVSKKESIKIYIVNRGQSFGKFTLKTGEDLTKVIDGLVELLDLELVENRKLSKGEILSFKSKQSAIEPYSALQIMDLNDKLTIRSIPNLSKPLIFDFEKNLIQNGRHIFKIKDIHDIIIENLTSQSRVQLVLKQGEFRHVFFHSTTEINAIRASKLLLETLDHRQELQGIAIELIEKT